MANLHYCLICSSEVINDNEEGNSEKSRSQFQEGLQLFCKLLQISGNYVDKVLSDGGKGVWKDTVVGKLPCCKECWLAFEQMLRLQQAIELMQTNLMEQLGKLKSALKSSVPRSEYDDDPWKITPDDIFGKIRDELLSCVRNCSTTSLSTTSDHQPGKRRRILPKKSSRQPDLVISKKEKEYLPCSVILERLPLHQLNILPKTEPGTSDPIGEDNCRDFNDEEYLPSPEEAPSSPTHDNHDDDNDDDEDEYPWESEAEPIPEPLPNKVNSGSSGTGRQPKFSLISPDTLLYQYTLIKVSQGYTHFTCQEPECPSPHFPDLSLNWNSLFNQMADHIKHVHNGPPAKDKFGRKCPLCPSILPAGPKFRAHLVGIGIKRESYCHRIETVVCEVCWRPLRNISDFYRCHLWDHKNAQEKEESPEGLPPTLVSRAKKLLKQREKSGLPIKSEKPEVKPKLTLKMQKHKGVLKSKKKTKVDDKPVNTIKKQGSVTKWKRRPPQIGDHFCRILEDSRESLLLYKSTLLKASYGVSLTCQQSNCDHIINGTDFTAFEEFKNHVNNCHAIEKPDSVWKCPLCPEELESRESFRRHVLYKCYTVSSFSSNGFPFICTACWKPMLSVDGLEYHQWLHKSEIEKESAFNDEERPPPSKVARKEKEREFKLKCGHCEREFNFVANLKAHEATHVPKEERNKYICHQCPRQFLSPVALRGHVEREHQRELMKMRTCPICSKQFNWRGGFQFRRHLKSHRNERDFVCDVCGKAFLDGQALKRHRAKVHEGNNAERRWKCEFCEMSYKEKAHLKRHMRNAHKVGEEMVEDEEQQRIKFTLPEYRPDFIGPKIAFPCPLCEKTFPLKSRMKKHLEKTCKFSKL